MPDDSTLEECYKLAEENNLVPKLPPQIRSRVCLEEYPACAAGLQAYVSTCHQVRARPKLPVARVVWVPRPSLPVAAACWIHAGGAHHTGFSKAVTAEHMQDYAEMAGVEFLRIGAETQIPEFRKELRWNEAYYHLANGF